MIDVYEPTGYKACRGVLVDSGFNHLMTR